MRIKHLLLLAGIFGLFVAAPSLAQDKELEDAISNEPINTKDGVDEAIDEHLGDAHYFELFADNEAGKHYGFSLPVIIVDDGVKAFSAARFEHGAKLVEEGGQHYRLYKNKIYKTDASGELTFNDKGFVTNAKPLDLSITKNVFVTLLVYILIFFVFRGMAKAYQKQKLPKGFGRLLEPIIVCVRDDIAKNTIGTRYKKFMSYLLSIFFFILFLNLLGMLPFGVNVTGNITVTFALAMITFFVVQLSGSKDYWK